jgi:chemotaxis protein MotB
MKKTAKGHVSHERWLVFYVDFITLLFAFFVVLYATSKADLKKQARVASSIDSAFRALGMFQTQPEIDPNKAPDHPDGPMSPTNIVMETNCSLPPRPGSDQSQVLSGVAKAASRRPRQHFPLTLVWGCIPRACCESDARLA